MSKLIRNGRVVPDEWKVLRLADGDTAQSVKLPSGPVLVPVSVWKARRRELVNREYEHGSALGVWLASGENPQVVQGDIDDFSVIAIEFDKFNAGSNYLAPRLLREQHGYKGELRAIGDVPQEKLAELHQTGFDAVEIRAENQAVSPLTRLFDFGQVAVDGKLLAA